MTRSGGTFSLVNRETITRPKGKSRSTALINPVFMKIRRYIDDDYWKSFLEELAINKFPKGFSFKDGYLIYRKPGKTYKTKLDDDREIAGKQTIEFFHEYASKYSPDEKKIVVEEDYEITWKGLKNLEKYVYIEDYIKRMKSKWKLNQEEFAYFSNEITNGINNGSIKSNRIILKGKGIKKIEDVEFDRDTREFEIKLTSRRTNTKSKASKRVDPLVKQWIKYLKKIQSHRNIKKNKKNK